jgi:hypothetical protein
MNEITAIGTLAIAVSKIGFYIISWILEEMQKFERESRKMQEL